MNSHRSAVIVGLALCRLPPDLNVLLKNVHEEAKLMLGEIQVASAEQRGQLWANSNPS